MSSCHYYYEGQKQGRNEFVIRLQPKEAIYMKLTVRNNLHKLRSLWKMWFVNYIIFLLPRPQVKQPGLEMSTVQSELDLSYGQRYQGTVIPEAYERLILDT